MEVSAGDVIAYISSSSLASSPASSHGSPNSSNSDTNGNPKNGDLSNIEGILQNDQIDCSMKTSKLSASGWQRVIVVRQNLM
ncbi:Hypothetical predicted protein, partial [Marmota monax]